MLSTSENFYIKILKTDWVSKSLFDIEWDKIFFLDKNPDDQVKNLKKYGYDQATAELYVELQFLNVGDMYVYADTIVDSVEDIHFLLGDLRC